MCHLYRKLRSVPSCQLVENQKIREQTQDGGGGRGEETEGVRMEGVKLVGRKTKE